MKEVIVFIGLLLGNSVVQLLANDPNWIVAIERSYFQAVALFTYWICTKYLWHND